MSCKESAAVQLCYQNGSFLLSYLIAIHHIILIFVPLLTLCKCLHEFESKQLSSIWGIISLREIHSVSQSTAGEIASGYTGLVNK